MADFFASISSQVAAASAQAATMSFSTVTGTAGVLPTPSSCASKTISFSSGANSAGCTFGPEGDDISPYKDCCKSAPLLTYSDGCGFYCKAQGQSLDALQNCLSKIKDTRSISCSSTSSSGGGNGGNVNSFSSSSSGGGNVHIGGSSSSSSSGPSDDNTNDFDNDFFNDNEDDNNDSGDDSQGGSSNVASTEAVAGPGQTAIARTSNGPNGASGFGTTINGVPFPSGVALPSGGIVNNNGGQGGSDVVASTEAVAGPGQTAIASTSAGPNGAAGFGTTIGGVAGPSGFVSNPSGGAPFPQGNSTATFVASNAPSGSPTGTAPFQSFTGAAASVKTPGAGISKGGLLTVGLLVFGAFTGAML